jgi:hypothetical protein
VNGQKKVLKGRKEKYLNFIKLYKNIKNLQCNSNYISKILKIRIPAPGKAVLGSGL